MATQISWDEVAGDFEHDGALRDVYVFDATVEDWQAVWEAVLHRYTMRTCDGAPPPTDVRAVVGSDARPVVTLDPGGLSANCHFFNAGEIEFDLNPDQINSQATLDRLCEFLALVGTAAGKDAVVTMENMRGSVTLRYDRRADRVVRGPGFYEPNA
jgi:hypothetical protein